MRHYPCVLLLVAVAFAGAVRAEVRSVIELSAGWRFIRQDAGLAADPASSGWIDVVVPHTWNALDGQDGKAAQPRLRDGYWRGAAWYACSLPALAPSSGRRIFVRFEAASLVADAWLNGVHLGQHRGGFSAFAFELTRHWRAAGPNELRVRVDNTQVPDVAPLEGDFTVFGGLYRPVSLLVTDEVCISPLHHGSPGVFLTPREITDRQATVGVRVELSNAGGETAVEVETQILDQDGRAVARAAGPAVLAAGTGASAALEVTVPQPRRWHGRADPYLYTAVVRLRRGGEVLDEVRQPLGLRTIELSNDRGFLLNGTPYAVHGVNRHQDRLDKGWAVARADHEEDVAMIVEMGCTGLRLAHYQQSDFVHDLCDRAGLVVWQEIPLVNRITGLPAFAENAKQQLTEMILQGYNHPSLCFWGLFNELNAAWAEQPGPDPDALIAGLRRLAEQLDPGRPAVGASWLRTPASLHTVPAAIAFNTYPGWYWGHPDDFTPMLEQIRAPLGGRRVGISEYGAGASVLHHQEGELRPPKDTGAPFHPEEWQTYHHQRTWAQMRGNPALWGTWVWVMFDFASDGRNEGDSPGRNDKGLVTFDRKTRKDAFFFYKANWTTEPLVHIAARRSTPRRQPATAVEVFSNCPAVELWVNGVSWGRVAPDEVRVARWPDVKLQPGLNRIEAVGATATGTVRDRCEWLLQGP